MKQARYVFRHPKGKGHTFITTEDPSYRYNVLCGHCEFPIEQEDDACPRCRRALEDCPVCRHRCHVRSPVERDDDQPQRVHCPVCLVDRFPVGWTVLEDLPRSFCTNLYGCPAGGMLLSSDELAVLPANPSGCPVCEHPELTPKSVAAFRHHVSHCLFCSTLFAIDGVWSRGWNEESLERLPEVSPEHGKTRCLLCGRKDRKHEGENGELHVRSESLKLGADDLLTRGVEVGAYLRVVELARCFVLDTEDDDAAFRSVFKLWFDPSGTDAEAEQSHSVRELVEVLVGGTLEPGVRGMLQRRLDRFENAWEKVLGISLDYRVRFRDPKQRDSS